MTPSEAGATLPPMDSDKPTDPTDTQAQPAPVEDTPVEQSEAAPADTDEDAGAAPTPDVPAAVDTAPHADTLIGDWATPDIDLSHLTPTDDGDPDDDPDGKPAPAETVDQDATGQAVVQGDTPDPAPEHHDASEPTA